MIGNKQKRQNSSKRSSRPQNTKSSKNKQSNNKQYFKQKPLNEKLKNMEDEEILSGSEGGMEDDDNIGNDEFFDVDDDQKDAKNSAVKAENTDEKRLRLAKKLINQIGDDITKDTKEEKEDDMGLGDGDEVDEYLREQIKKEKQEYFLELASLPNFNPVETSFYKGHLSSITSVDISSSSTTALTCSKDCRGIKWDLETGKKFLLPQFSTKALYSCIFTPDDNFGLFAGADKHIHQMDLRSEKIVQSFKAHNDTITGLIFDQNKDQFYSVSRDTTLKVWGVGTTRKSILLETFYGHTDRINDIDIMSGYLKSENNDVVAKVNRLLTCANDFNVNLWKTDTQSYLQFKSPENLYQIDLVKSLNNEFFMSGSYDGMISLWKTNKKKPVFKLSNTHGYEKKKELNHAFFKNVCSDDEDDLTSFDTTHSNGQTINLSYPILSLGCIKNSDLIFSGSSNGHLNFYKYNQVAKKDSAIPGKFKDSSIVKIKDIPLKNKGCVNAIKVNSTNKFLVLANGKDSRLGRWDSEPKAKNGISIVKLFD